MWYVYEIIQDNDEHTCDGGRTILRLLCLFVLTGKLIVTDFAESVGIWQWARQFPDYNGDRDDPQLKGKHTGFIYQNLPDLGLAVPITGITPFQFRIAVLLILIKTALGVGLLYIAGGYVAFAGSSEDLVLNSVAMLFISEADELCYLLIVPDFVRRVQEAMPPIVKHPDSWDEEDLKGREVSTSAKLVVKWWVALAVTGALYFSWCRKDEFPDVTDHIVHLAVMFGGCVAVVCCVVPCCLIGSFCCMACFSDRVLNTSDTLGERVRNTIMADRAGSVA